MFNTIEEVLEDLRKEVSGSMKQKYGLEEITVPRTLSSQILAAKMKGKKTLTFKLNKTAMNRGILEILWGVAITMSYPFIYSPSVVKLMTCES